MYSICKFIIPSALTYIEIEKRIHLVLYNGDGFKEFLCVHASHHSIHTEEKRIDFKMGQMTLEGIST